jgi:xylulokinase
VCAVGVAGMAEAGAPLDSAGRPLAPVMAWHDPRGQDAVDRLRQQFGGDELDRRIGHRLRTVSSVAKMGWLADHGGLDGAAVWLGVPELVVHALTGAQVTEHSLASRTGCYDVAARNWLPEVAEGAGLPPTALPEVRAAGTAMGRVTGPGGQWSGLPAGIPVTLAGHDHLAGAEGVGAEPGDALDSMGTAETVLRRTPRLPSAEHALGLRLAVSVRPGGRGFTVVASAVRAGAVLTTAAGILGRAPADLDAMAAACDGVDASALVAPLARGEPVDFPAASPGPIWAGLLHALALSAAEAGRRLEDLLGSAPSRLLAYGGGSRSQEWMRAKAIVAGLPVWRSTVAEAAARGAAVTAGVAAGLWPSAEAAPPPVLEPVI